MLCTGCSKKSPLVVKGARSPIKSTYLPKPVPKNKLSRSNGIVVFKRFTLSTRPVLLEEKSEKNLSISKIGKKEYILGFFLSQFKERKREESTKRRTVTLEKVGIKKMEERKIVRSGIALRFFPNFFKRYVETKSDKRKKPASIFG